MLIPVLAFFAYITAYLGRINLSITIPYLQNELGYSKTALGILASGFFCTYAIGQLINGVLGDRINVRFFVALGLLVAGIGNIGFALCGTFPLMLLAWAANGYFQSMLWGPLLRAISESVPQKKLYFSMSMMAISPIIGHFLAYVLAGQLSLTAGWETAFLVPGILLIIMAAIWYRTVPKTLRSGINEDKNRHKPASANIQTAGRELIRFIIQSKLYLMLLLGILIGIIKEGLTLWGPVIFIEMYSLEMEKMVLIMSFMPLANLLFILLGGLLIRKFFKNEKYAILMFLLLAILPTVLIWQVNNPAFLLAVISFYGLMASVYTVNNQIVTFLPLNFKESGKVSTAAGTIDSSIYLGAVIAGPLIGTASETFGWNGIFAGILFLCVAALLPVLFLLRTGKKSDTTAEIA